jgi:hypothetical protein
METFSLARIFGIGFRSVTKPHRNLKVYTRKETTLRLTQSVLRAAKKGTLCRDSRCSRKMICTMNVSRQECWRRRRTLRLSNRPNGKTDAEEDCCGQKPRRFLEESQRSERVNDTNVGVPAKRAVAVKIKTHDCLAIHTPKSYGHLFVSVLQTSPLPV